MKHLLYEHQENLSDLKVEGTLSMKRAQQDHWAQEMELRKDMRSLKVELKEQELANEVVVKNMRLVRPRWAGAADEVPLLQREVVGPQAVPSQPRCAAGTGTGTRASWGRSCEPLPQQGAARAAGGPVSCRLHG